MASGAPRRISFTDTVLKDGAVARIYTDGCREQRIKEAPDRIRWSDSTGNTGTDSDLGGGRIRREDARGAIAEGQHLGSGITSWNDGAYVTVNETPIPESAPQVPRPGGLRGVLLGLGLGTLFGVGAGSAAAIGIDPAAGDYDLYAEEYHRQQMQRHIATAPVDGRAPLDDGGGDVSGIFSLITDSFG